MRYMIAQQMRMAAQIIRVELTTWQQIDRFEFIDDDGEHVKVLDGSRASILGRKFDRIYLAYGWRQALTEPLQEEIFRMANAFDAKITYVERNGELHDA